MEYIKKQSFAAYGIFLASSICVTSAQAASVSDLFITEIMVNPAQVSDTNGEWFELFNPTLEAINLEGMILSDDGSNSHTISTGSALLVNPGEYFVMGRNGDSASNGGYVADYTYSGFTLGNSGDQIVISDGISELLRFEYGASFDTSGVSMELIGQEMLESNYALTDSSFTYGLGDIGTPGAAGSFVPSPAPVPVPAAFWLFGSGLVGLVGVGRRYQSIA